MKYRFKYSFFFFKKCGSGKDAVVAEGDKELAVQILNLGAALQGPRLFFIMPGALRWAYSISEAMKCCIQSNPDHVFYIRMSLELYKTIRMWSPDTWLNAVPLVDVWPQFCLKVFLLSFTVALALWEMYT